VPGEQRAGESGLVVEYNIVIHIFSEVTDALATLHVKTVRDPVLQRNNSVLEKDTPKGMDTESEIEQFSEE